ncbi:MAG TPA: AMP-binding protein [Gemmatimonadales bacterium]|nr:AMP-binding protein [Gemmatimonadales bacterium]
MMPLPASADQCAALARRRLLTLLGWAGRTHFWAARLGGAGIGRPLRERDVFAALAELPPVSARELRLAGTGAVRDGWIRPWWASSLSSGSTAEPFRMYFDPRAWSLLRYRVKLRARGACGVSPHDRIAVLDAIPPAAEGRSAMERLGVFRRISVMQPVERMAEKLAAHRPAAVYGPPSALLAAGRALSGTGRMLSVRAVFASGEPLHASTRAEVAAAYGAPVLDVYGSAETKEIAWECLAGGRHVNADVLHVEIVRPDGRVASTGEEGEILVSVLVNRAMPLLRYATGDRGVLQPGQCACGSPLPLLELVSGREADARELDGRRVAANGLTAAMERVEGLVRYRASRRVGRHPRMRATPARQPDPARADHGVRAVDRLADGPAPLSGSAPTSSSDRSDA